MKYKYPTEHWSLYAAVVMVFFTLFGFCNAILFRDMYWLRYVGVGFIGFMICSLIFIKQSDGR
tara:strand:+ start:21424 stop:21612 length:189 start_codon:yes stop_codon:yes gene_type:complete